MNITFAHFISNRTGYAQS